MNLINGELVADISSSNILDGLFDTLTETLSRKPLSPDIVINACNTLSLSITDEYLAMLTAAGIPEERAGEYLQEAKIMLSGSVLEKRIERELGPEYAQERSFQSISGKLVVTERLLPLGVLLHITAGNQTGLALYSVIEGLLTANINIVKLSSYDDGLSILVLKKLIDLEPRLRDYIYVFDIPSSDTQAVKRLLSLSDAVTIWGGDAAVASIRRMASPGTKIIEWGHKLSFAYVTQRGMSHEAMSGLAKNIISTNSLLCSSCQGVFVNTDSMDALYDFCGRFLQTLEEQGFKRGEKLHPALRAQSTIKRYTRSLEESCRAFTGERTSLTAFEDDALEASAMYGNCWVKRLPDTKIIKALHPYRPYLQTAALLCAEDERPSLREKLFRAGVVRITQGENMSETYPEGAHDGEYGMRRYVKLASEETSIPSLKASLDEEDA